mgnify:FL=1
MPCGFFHSTPKEVDTLRKRNYRVGVRFNHAEHERFQKLVKDSGLSQEEYLRQLVRGVVPRDAPPPDYYKMMRQLYHIGNSLNQIAKKAHVLNVMDVKRYDEAVSEFEQALKRITEAVILPTEK